MLVISYLGEIRTFSVRSPHRLPEKSSTISYPGLSFLYTSETRLISYSFSIPKIVKVRLLPSASLLTYSLPPDVFLSFKSYHPYETAASNDGET